MVLVFLLKLFSRLLNVFCYACLIFFWQTGACFFGEMAVGHPGHPTVWSF